MNTVRCIIPGLIYLLTAASRAEEKKSDQPPSAQLTFDFDWITVPLPDASRLLREKAPAASDATALRAALDEMLAQKKARRVDLTRLTVLDGETGKAESQRERNYATDWRVDPAAEGTFTIQPAATAVRNLGCKVETAAQLWPNGRGAGLLMEATRQDWMGDLVWREGKEELRRPVFTVMQTTNQSSLPAGVWTLRGIFHTFTAPPDGLKQDAEPPLPERTFLLARATIDAPQSDKPADPAAKRSGLLTAEWIEADADTAAALLQKNSPLTGGETIRRALDAEITAGRAALSEITALPLAENGQSKIDSHREHEFAEAINLPGAKEQGLARQKATQDGAVPQLPKAGDSIETFFKFQETDCGLLLEAEAKFTASPPQWRIAYASAVRRVQGMDQPPPADALRPCGLRMQRLESNGTVFLTPGLPVLAQTMEVRTTPAKGEAAPPPGPRRVMMLFFKLAE